jgi:hypothetical protein
MLKDTQPFQKFALTNTLGLSVMMHYKAWRWNGLQWHGVNTKLDESLSVIQIYYGTSRHARIYKKLSSPPNSKINRASKKRHELFQGTSYNMAHINTCNFKKDRLVITTWSTVFSKYVAFDCARGIHHDIHLLLSTAVVKLTALHTL